MAALEGLIEIADANQPGQVLAMDDQTDDSEGDALPPPLFQVDPIEIVPFTNFNNLQPIIPEGISYKDLLGDINPLNPNDINLNENQNLQVGFVELF